MLTLAIGVGFVKYYIDAKIDPIAATINELRTYMVDHAERIAGLETKTRNL